MYPGEIRKLVERLDKPYVMILIGPPLSGKTTFLNTVLIPDTFRHISTDNLVLELDKVGDGDYDRAWKEADWKFIKKYVKDQMRECNEASENTVIDFTNLRGKRRRSNLGFFSKKFYKIAVIFPILEDDEYDIRNKSRFIAEKKSIKKNLMKELIDSTQPIDPKLEKYDKIIRL